MVAQVQVTVPLTATVSTAGLDDPFSPLLKKMSPTVTAAVAGAALPVPPAVPPPVPPLVPPPLVGGLIGIPLLGLVGVESSLQPASRLAASIPLTSTIIVLRMSYPLRMCSAPARSPAPRSDDTSAAPANHPHRAGPNQCRPEATLSKSATRSAKWRIEQRLGGPRRARPPGEEGDSLTICWRTYEMLRAGPPSRRMWSFAMRACSVVGLRPRILAAPPSPLTFQPVRSSTLRMCARWRS